MADTEKSVPVSFVRHYKLTEHTCPICQTVFQAPRLRVYCGAECKQKAAWERHGAEFNERRKTKQAMKKAGDTKGGNDATQ